MGSRTGSHGAKLLYCMRTGAGEPRMHHGWAIRGCLGDLGGVQQRQPWQHPCMKRVHMESLYGLAMVM